LTGSVNIALARGEVAHHIEGVADHVGSRKTAPLAARPHEAPHPPLHRLRWKDRRREKGAILLKQMSPHCPESKAAGLLSIIRGYG
jgi:hypothetical protein